MAGTPLRLGFIVHQMQVAGAEVLVTETIRRLGGLLEATVLCLDGLGQLGEELRAEGVPVVVVGRRPGVDARTAWRLSREIVSRRIELVHAHQYTPFFYGALAKVLTSRQVRVMFTEHGRHYPDVVSRRRRVLNRLVLSRLADEINGVSEFSIRSLASMDGFGAREMEVIPNGIDPDRYGSSEPRDELRRRLGLDPGRRYVSCVARFHPVKDHRTLLEAFSRVARSCPDVDLLLVGDGELRGELEQRARQADLAGRVRFAGVRADVPTWLAASDAFVLSSLSEAASLTLLEAMASALPVVVTDVGGNPEVVRHGVDGLLVPRRDERALAEALHAVLADPSRGQAMGLAARQRVCECYRIERTVERYYERYVALVRNVAGAPRLPTRRVTNRA